MLAIRLQRLGRKGYPVYRIAVQEAQRHPSSGRIVAYVGSYNPHTKQVTLNKEKIELYLKNGAQPSPHVVKLLVQAKVNLPDWVRKHDKKDKKLRNPDKLRKNRSDEPKEPAAEISAPADPVVEETPGVSSEALAKDESTAADEEPAEVAPAEAEKPEASEEKAEPEAEKPTEEPTKAPDKKA